MKRNLTHSALVCALIISVSAVVCAQSSPPSDATKQFLTNPGLVSAPKSNEKLKSDVAKMVAETKAGRRGAPATSAFPQPQRNNLSKTAKIAIVAGIVIAVVAIIAVHSFKYDCKSRCVL
jgi:hypothetical protein